MLFRRQRNPGWMAIRVTPERIDVAHVLPGARPLVSRWESHDVAAGRAVETLRELRGSLLLDRYRCTTLMEFPEYQTHQVEAPGVPDAELRQAVRWSIKDLIDYPIDEAVVDAVRIPAGEEQRSRSVLVVSARSQHAAAAARQFEEARVPLDAIDIPEFAQRNLCALCERERRAVGMLAFHSGSCWLTITADGELLVVRRIDISLDRLVDADPDQRAIYLDRIALELQRSFDNFDRQFAFVGLSRLVLAYVPAECGLKPTLQANLDLPVDDLALAEVMDLSRVSAAAQGEYPAERLLVLGAALRSTEARQPVEAAA